MANSSWLLIAALAAPAVDSLTAKLDGKPFTSEWTNASKFMLAGKEVVNFNGHIGTGPGSRFFNCQVASAAPGVFKIGEGPAMAKTSCSYLAGADVMADRYSFKSGTVELTAVDAAHVAGKFEGSAKNHDGKTVEVTGGVFITGTGPTPAASCVAASASPGNSYTTTTCNTATTGPTPARKISGMPNAAAKKS